MKEAKGADLSPRNAVAGVEAELTARALVLAAGENAEGIDAMWAHKARLIEERDGEIGDVA